MENTNKNKDESLLDKVKDKVNNVVEEFKSDDTNTEDRDVVDEDVEYPYEVRDDSLSDGVSDIPVERFDDEGDVIVSEYYVEGNTYEDEDGLDLDDNIEYDNSLDTDLELEEDLEVDNTVDEVLSEEDYEVLQREDTLENDLTLDTQNGGLNRDNEKL